MRWRAVTAFCFGGLVLAGSVPRASATGEYVSISLLGFDQVHAAVAYNIQDREYLVVWQNEWPGNRDIYGQRVRANGSLNGEWFPISVGSGDRYFPDVTYNDDRNEYLVVWEHDDGVRPNIRGWRVSSTGQLLGSELILGSGVGLTSRFAPAVAYATVAAKYLVVWTAHTQGATSTDVEAQVVLGTGALDGVNFSIAAGTLAESHDRPDVAYNRSRNEHLVVWRHHDGDYSISARRVQGAGTPMSPEVITVNDWANEEDAPRVAAVPTSTNFGKYIVVWQMQISGANHDIYSRVVEGDGTPSTMIAVASSNDYESVPDVAGSEATGRFLVSWTAPGAGTTGVRQQQLSLSNGLVGTTMWVDGFNADNAAVGTDGAGGFLVAYDSIPVPANGRDVYGWISNLLFSDGFESNTTGAWSTVAP